MTPSEFKAEVNKSFINIGFSKNNSCLCKDFDTIFVIISVSKGFGAQYFINIGFWIKEIGELPPPPKVERSHIYLRFESFFSEYREVILTAGAIRDKDSSVALSKLKEIIELNFNDEIHKLSAYSEMRSALNSGRLCGSLARKEAREYLSRDLRSI